VLRAAIANEQADLLRVPGVGPKTAKAIILHLKDKIGAGLAPAAVAYLTDADAEVISALTSLGYSVVEAQTALASLPHDKDTPIEERIRMALAYFARP
jgi:holliday junction DNA helicase RuvA